jgi:hypothetical protein
VLKECSKKQCDDKSSSEDEAEQNEELKKKRIGLWPGNPPK